MRLRSILRDGTDTCIFGEQSKQNLQRVESCKERSSLLRNSHRRATCADSFIEDHYGRSSVLLQTKSSTIIDLPFCKKLDFSNNYLNQLLLDEVITRQPQTGFERRLLTRWCARYAGEFFGCAFLTQCFTT
jgi:hypothetical protein